MRGPGHYLEECKVLKEYSKKYGVQRPNTDIEARSGGKTKCNNTVEFYSSTKEANIMERDAPINKKKKEKND